jgi:hypothetical protein
MQLLKEENKYKVFLSELLNCLVDFSFIPDATVYFNCTELKVINWKYTFLPVYF